MVVLHPMFTKFKYETVTGTGEHVFDFLGVRASKKYVKGWDVQALPKGNMQLCQFPYPNEHYFDWVALLTSVSESNGTFRMAELGAGYGRWIVRGAVAARQNKKIKQIELVAIEADLTHYQWMIEHIHDNSISPDDIRTIHGAVWKESQMLKFPIIASPSENYGASLQGATKNVACVDVMGYTLQDALSSFTGPIDLVHMDIQGAEYDIVPGAMDFLRKHVKSLVIGTHTSQEHNLKLFNLLSENGWTSVYFFPRNEEVLTEFGKIKFGDGFQYWRNCSL